MKENSNMRTYNLRKTDRSKALKEFSTPSKTPLIDLINNVRQNEQPTKKLKTINKITMSMHR